MDKFIIALSSSNNTGKTAVMNEVWDLLPSYLPPGPNQGKEIFSNPYSLEIIGTDTPHFPSKKDYINRKEKIGVNSIGDLSIHIVCGLIFLIKKNCDIIICTCHNKPMLLKAIKEFDIIYSKKKNSKEGKFWRKIFVTYLGQDITDKEAKEIKDKYLPEFNIITTTHFCFVDFKNAHSSKKNSNIKLPLKIGSGINLNRLSAFHILDFIERLTY